MVFTTYADIILPSVDSSMAEPEIGHAIWGQNSLEGSPVDLCEERKVAAQYL